MSGAQQVWGNTDCSKLQTFTAGFMALEIRDVEDSAEQLHDWQLFDTFACSLCLGCPLSSAELLKRRLQGWLHLQGSPSLGAHRGQES